MLPCARETGCTSTHARWRCPSGNEQTVNGRREPGFAPLSGFFEARDGWARTHANYPHHLVRLLRALALPEDATREDAAAAIAERSAQEVEDVVTANHGIAARVRPVAEWMSSEAGRAVAGHDLLTVAATATAVALTLSRCPVDHESSTSPGCSRGRLRRGPWRSSAATSCGSTARTSRSSKPSHLDTDAGKRSTLVDLQDEHARHRLHELLAEADVLVTGYRPGALAGYGLDPDHLAERHPHLVCATLTAWTPSGPWGRRRGFDSIVQAATGIALIESRDGASPGALPAQALDHATGYLLAAGVLSALRRRATEGGTWRVEAHLARTAHWLLQTDALDGPAAPVDDPGPWLVESRCVYGRVAQSRPAFGIDDAPRQFAWVGRRWGSDEAVWEPTG